MTDARDEQEDHSPAEPPDHLAGLKGMDLVRRALEEARGAARAEGKDVGRGRTSPPPRRVAGAGRRRSWSGPGPDTRDPQLLGSATSQLAKTRGWSRQVSEGAVFGQWPAVVGEDIAEQVGDREEQHSGEEGDRAEHRHLDGGDFRRTDEV